MSDDDGSVQEALKEKRTRAFFLFSRNESS